MGSKYFLLILVLQIVQSSLGADVVTVYDVAANISEPIIGATYQELASALPDKLPAEIKASTSKGFWVFQESTQGGLFALTSKTKFEKVSLKVYTTAPANLYFEDKSSDAETPAPAVVIPATVDPKWTDHTFDFVRDNASTEIFTLRIQITETTGNNGLFLVDSISVTAAEEVIISTTTEAGSSAIAPTLITFVSLAILKTFL